MKKITKVSIALSVAVLLVVLTVTALIKFSPLDVALLVSAQTQGVQTQTSQGQILRKSVIPDNLWKGIVVINLSGLLKEDLVNIRPSTEENKVEAASVTVVPSSGGLAPPTFGSTLADSSLQVTAEAISFTRPNVT